MLGCVVSEGVEPSALPFVRQTDSCPPVGVVHAFASTTYATLIA